MTTYKTITNRVNNDSVAMLGIRINETVNKSGIEEAKTSNQYQKFIDVNERYQNALSDEAIRLTETVSSKFDDRKALFLSIYDYLQGLLNSPDNEMHIAASMLFERINKYGRTFSKVKIADQSVRYIRIIESLKKEECAAALTKTLLTDKVAALDQIQRDYEDLYMERGDISTSKVSPSSIRKELNAAIKLYIDEVNWMAIRTETEPWQTLYIKLKQRFDEVNTMTKAKSKTATTDTTTSTVTQPQA